MRICMVAARHSLDDARIVHKQSVSLRNAGHDVVLLFMCDDAWQYRRFDGEVLAVGRAPDGAASYEGFKVVGSPKRTKRHKVRQFREMAALAVALKADVYHAHEPDMALAVALRAKRVLARGGHRAYVVHDMHEYPPGGWVDSAPRALRGAMHCAVVGRDMYLSRNVDYAFTANAIVRGYALVLSRQTPTDVLYNGPALRLFPQAEPPTWTGREPLIVSHEGSLGFNRGLKEMVGAVDQLRDRVRLRIVGDVFGEQREWLDREVERRGLGDAVTRTGWLRYSDVGSAVRQGHAGLIMFRDSLNNVLAGPPNKLFNYMNAGLPVLSVAFPEIRRIVQEAECGILVNDQSVGAIVCGIEHLLEIGPVGLRRMGVAGQQAIRERYSWEVMERTMLAAYGDMALRWAKH